MAIFGNGNIIPLVIVCFFVFTNFLLLDILLSAEEHRLESFSTFERTSKSVRSIRAPATTARLVTILHKWIDDGLQLFLMDSLSDDIDVLPDFFYDGLSSTVGIVVGEADFTHIFQTSSHHWRISVSRTSNPTFGAQSLVGHAFIRDMESGVLLIHLVFMHNHPGDFWWIGALSASDGADELWTVERATVKFTSRRTTFPPSNFTIPVASRRDLTLLLRGESEFVRCPGEPLTVHPMSNMTQAEVDRYRAGVQRFLLYAEEVFRSHDKPLWISSSTLLGWLRQCDIIEYARDVDFGAFAGDFDSEAVERLIWHFSAIGDLPIVHWKGRVNDSLELAFVDVENQVKMDLYFFYEDRSTMTMWNGNTDAGTRAKFRYDFPVFRLCTASLTNILVHVPCDAVRYAESIYGSAWRTPTTVWDWRTSPHNVVPNGYWSESERGDAIRIYL